MRACGTTILCGHTTRFLEVFLRPWPSSMTFKDASWSHAKAGFPGLLVVDHLQWKDSWQYHWFHPKKSGWEEIERTNCSTQINNLRPPSQAAFIGLHIQRAEQKTTLDLRVPWWTVLLWQVIPTALRQNGWTSPGGHGEILREDFSLAWSSRLGKNDSSSHWTKGPRVLFVFTGFYRFSIWEDQALDLWNSRHG